MSYSKPTPKLNFEAFNFAGLLKNVSSQRGNAEVTEARNICARNFFNLSETDKQLFIQLLIQSGFTYSWNPDQVDFVVNENEALAAARGFQNTGPLNRARIGKEAWKELMMKIWSGVKRDYWSVGNFYVANLSFCTDLGEYFYATGGVAFNGVISHSRFWFRCMQWEQVQTILDLQVDACIAVLGNITIAGLKGPFPKVDNPYMQWKNIPFSSIQQMNLNLEKTSGKVFLYLQGKGTLDLEDYVLIANINKPSVYLTNATVAKSGKIIKDEYVKFVLARFEKLRAAFNNAVKIDGGPLEPEFSFDSKAGFSASYSFITSYVQYFVAQVRTAANGGGQQLKNEPRAFQGHTIQGKSLYVPQARGSRQQSSNSNQSMPAPGSFATFTTQGRPVYSSSSSSSTRPQLSSHTMSLMQTQ